MFIISKETLIIPIRDLSILVGYTAVMFAPWKLVRACGWDDRPGSTGL